MRKAKFKAIDARTRRSTNWVIGVRIEETRRQRITKYILTYKKNKIVKAPDGSHGIFVFDTEEQARKFCDREGILRFVKIVKVTPMGRGKRPKRILQGAGDWWSKIKNFYEGKISNDKITSPPKGSICYPAVKVLE